MNNLIIIKVVEFMDSISLSMSNKKFIIWFNYLYLFDISFFKFVHYFLSKNISSVFVWVVLLSLESNHLYLSPYQILTLSVYSWPSIVALKNEFFIFVFDQIIIKAFKWKHFFHLPANKLIIFFIIHFNFKSIWSNSMVFL